MARKKAKTEPKPRTDADRRARQCERLSRHLRVLHCIMGPGRWDVEALSRELECSARTVHRILQTLTMANVPWYFCKNAQCYRVQPGFRFPGVEGKPENNEGFIDPESILPAARQLLEDGEKFVESLRRFCDVVESPQTP